MITIKMMNRKRMSKLIKIATEKDKMAKNEDHRNIYTFKSLTIIVTDDSYLHYNNKYDTQQQTIYFWDMKRFYEKGHQMKG